MRYLKLFRLFEGYSPLLDLKSNIDRDMIKKISILRSHGDVLELACGNGSDAAELKRYGYNVTCVDNNQEYVDHVNGMGVKCLLHNIGDVLPFGDKLFDVVYSRFGLHYFTENKLNEVFTEIFRVMKSGGYLVFTVKLANDIDTGKVILDENKWIGISKDAGFDVISKDIKEGIQYGSHARWLETICRKSI